MGFLSGAYGKLQAGRLVRDIQHQLTSVNRRIRRVTRDMHQKQKMYQSQERNMKLQMQNQMRMFIGVGLQNYMQKAAAGGNEELANQFAAYGNMFGLAVNGADMSNAGLGLFGSTKDMSIMSAASTTYSTLQQQAQMQYTQAMTRWENMHEMQEQADLDALKDLEEDLQSEKDSLESRLQIAKAEYDAKKQEEKDGAKSLQPDYTGQG